METRWFFMVQALKIYLYGGFFHAILRTEPIERMKRMKKLLVLLCALILFTVSAHAQTEYTAMCNGTPVLTLQYDEKGYALDTESYLSSSFGGHTWLGMFFNGSLTVELSADMFADQPDLRDMDALAAYLTVKLADEQCTLLEQYVTAQYTPFALFSLNGPTGPSYYAATLSHGYIVHFEIYNLRGGVGPDALATLKALLEGARV